MYEVLRTPLHLGVPLWWRLAEVLSVIGGGGVEFSKIPRSLPASIYPAPTIQKVSKLCNSSSWMVGGSPIARWLERGFFYKTPFGGYNTNPIRGGAVLLTRGKDFRPEF